MQFLDDDTASSQSSMATRSAATSDSDRPLAAGDINNLM